MSITMFLFSCMNVGASFREHLFLQARFCFVSSKVEVLTCMQEAGTGFASKPQTDDAEPGDIALDSWVRYDDPEVRTFKLNAERQNGRAAMLGITGCLIHELLGVDALYPTGGLGGAAPPPIIAALAVEGRSGKVQMFSEGDIGVLPPLGVYDPLGLIETRDMRRYERSNRSALDSNEPFSE